MSKLFKFDPAHLHLAKEIRWSPEAIVGIVERANNPEWFLFSCFTGGILQAVIGGKIISKGVAECLALPCSGFNPFSLHRGTLAAMQYAKDKLGIHRFQATVKCGFTKGADWLTSMGFQYEGMLKAYDGLTMEDHLMFGRVV